MLPLVRRLDSVYLFFPLCYGAGQLPDNPNPMDSALRFLVTYVSVFRGKGRTRSPTLQLSGLHGHPGHLCSRGDNCPFPCLSVKLRQSPSQTVSDSTRVWCCPGPGALGRPCGSPCPPQLSLTSKKIYTYFNLNLSNPPPFFFEEADKL